MLWLSQFPEPGPCLSLPRSSPCSEGQVVAVFKASVLPGCWTITNRALISGAEFHWLIFSESLWHFILAALKTYYKIMFVFGRSSLWLAGVGVRSMTGWVGEARLMKVPAKVTQAKLQHSHCGCGDDNESPLISHGLSWGLFSCCNSDQICATCHKCFKHTLVLY